MAVMQGFKNLGIEKGNPQGKTEVNSRQKLVKNTDGSVHLVFSPKKPDGVPEVNWIQTNPMKGFFA